MGNIIQIIHGEYVMVDKVVKDDSDFEKEWKKKKAEDAAKHKKSSNSMASRCVFAIKKLVGK